MSESGHSRRFTHVSRMSAYWAISEAPVARRGKGRKPELTALTGARDKPPPAPTWLPKFAKTECSRAVPAMVRSRGLASHELRNSPVKRDKDQRSAERGHLSLHRPSLESVQHQHLNHYWSMHLEQSNSRCGNSVHQFFYRASR